MITMWVNIMNLSYYLRVFTFIEKIMFIAKKKINKHILWVYIEVKQMTRPQRLG